MKKLLILVSALSIMLCCTVTAFADEPANVPSSDVVTAYDLDEAPAHAEGTLPAIVSRVFGTYTPRTQTVTVYRADGTTVETTEAVGGLAGMDWYWIAGVVLFALVLWSFFRLLGVVFRHE